ncbi:MAG: ECF-type sigma factor [Gammaproteobacteria bacterium]
MSQQSDITQLLQRWSGGDGEAVNTLSPLIYDELRRLAKSAFVGERSGHTLQATALVHEAFEKLSGSSVDWQSRGHFYALAARLMRRLLINHANARSAQKRGGSQVAVTFEDGLVNLDQGDEQLVALDEAIKALAELDERKAKLIDMQYFVGFSFKEMSDVTGLSSSTIDRELRLARLWLKDYLA